MRNSTAVTYSVAVSDVIEPLTMLSKIVLSRAIRRELKTLQEALVLQAMEKEMARPSPDVGTLRQATNFPLFYKHDLIHCLC